MSRDEQADLARLADAVMGAMEMVTDEFGAPGLDPKRPFGNSDVIGDIMEILEMTPDTRDEHREYILGMWDHQLLPYIKRRWAEAKEPRP